MTNQTNQRIAPHETFEIHEILTFKAVCATKASAMVRFVKDEELKTLLELDFTTGQEQIKELQGLLQASQFLEQTVTPIH